MIEGGAEFIAYSVAGGFFTALVFWLVGSMLGGFMHFVRSWIG